MDIKGKLMGEIFYKVDCDIDSNPAENHAMTVDHEEVLGQFLDFSGLSPDELRECLIRGFIY